jgi:hypothetical protein
VKLADERRRWIGAAAAAAAIALIGWLVHDPAGPAAPPAQVDSSEARAPDPPPEAPAPAPAPERPKAAPAEEPPPVIDEVSVEKQEVCAGEENLITVRAHTTNGTDAYLHAAIGGTIGSRVPLRIWPGVDGSYEPPTVTVFGRGNVMAEAPVPRYRVKDCKPDRNVLLLHRLLPNTVDEYELQARIVEVGAKENPDARPFRPVSYLWDFDDGSTEKTERPFVTHSYERRKQQSLVSELLIRLTVRGESGEQLRGRTLLQIPNVLFQNFAERGIITILASPTPRFPEIDGEGVVRQVFRLWHHRDEMVRIGKVTAVRHYVETNDNSPHETVSLGVSEIPPGDGVEVELKLDTENEPDVFTVTYYLEGETAEGHPAKGTFSLMRPPPKPTKESHIPVDDPVLLAKIKRAREILGQELVTDEDIWRLEREGKMDAIGPSSPAHPSGASSSGASARPR